jgi:hypothetical protein
MLVRVVVALAAIFVAGAAVVAMQPSRFRITRSAVVNATPGQVFDQVNDLHAWERWSPWLEADPSARTSYEGSAAGPGAVFTWAGNRNVGSGRMTITESRPPDLVRLRLDFAQPFESTSVAEFTFAPEGDRTLVTWSMSGDKNLVAKALHLVMNMDKMIGGKFEEGLARMKAAAEATASR